MTPRFALGLLLPALAACVLSLPQPPVLPLSMAPVRAVPLEEPASGETLAVIDIVDARPDFERSLAELDERFIGGRWLARDRFATFHPIGGHLAADPASPPDRRARVLGAAAFSWYPYPNHGIGKPVASAFEPALADYLALQFEQRGLFARVVRAPDVDAARAAGATLVLTATVSRFGAMLVEATDPFVVRPDHPVEWRVLGVAEFRVEIARAADGATLLARDCLGRDEEDHVLDRLAGFKGTQVRPYARADAEGFSERARHDLAVHARRALERATAPLVAAVEGAIRDQSPAQ